MSRPLRIEYPGAWYHVMNRGRRADDIFAGKKDYQCFVALLQETSEMWGIRIAAYCLMPTHYHLLVHTPHANLSRSMRHLNGIYTQRYNRRHGCDGQLFRGRYKAIVVEEDSYLLQLARYIHKNPVKAGIVESPDDYPWSSHNAYISGAKKWDWVYRQFLLSMLAPNKQASVRAYKAFMAETDDEVENILEGKKWPSFLGSAGFAGWIKAQFHPSKTDDEVPQAKDLVPDTARILNVVSAFYGISEADLYSSRRGYFNEPRNVAIYLARKLRRDTLIQLCKDFSINKYSSVSSIMGRMGKRMSEDETLRKNISQMKDIIQKSQGQI
ncbi:MAG: transposase [Thermodesulfobacteriota bacterium]|nr:transposase [Thermodesulfobacteriota bacterium]